MKTSTIQHVYTKFQLIWHSMWNIFTRCSHWWKLKKSATCSSDEVHSWLRPGWLSQPIGDPASCGALMVCMVEYMVWYRDIIALKNIKKMYSIYHMISRYAFIHYTALSLGIIYILFGEPGSSFGSRSFPRIHPRNFLDVGYPRILRDTQEISWICEQNPRIFLDSWIFFFLGSWITIFSWPPHAVLELKLWLCFWLQFQPEIRSNHIEPRAYI